MRINLPLILLLSSGLIFLLFSFKRLLRYLRYFQQEEYEAKRYVYWLIKNAAYDKRGSLSLVAAYLIYIIAADQIAAIASQIFLFSIFIYLEQDPRKTGKTKLVMTERATRILFLAAFVLASVYTASLLLIAQNGAINVVCLFLIQFALIQLTPYSLLLSNMLLSPFEKRVKGKFKQEAVDILKKVNPYIIGITGSYGKTSVKAALGEVLNNVLAPTFYPPKSINTEMGITREIRENLKSHHRYAIIEMGAYNVGSIKKLCAFTPPNAGIVTVVGMAHLERFGSRERVYQAKSELAQAVPSEGILVCNGDDPGARRMGEEHPKTKTLF